MTSHFNARPPVAGLQGCRAGQGSKMGQEVKDGALDGAWVGQGPQCGEMGLDSGYILGGGPGRFADGLAVGTKRKRLQ